MLVFESDGEVYLLVEEVIDLVLVVVYDIQVVVLGCLPGVDHVQVLHLAEYRSQLLVLLLQPIYFLVVLDLHHLPHPVLKAVDVVLDQQQLVLYYRLFVEQFGDFAEVLGLQEVVVAVLQVLDEGGLFVYQLVLVVDRLDQDIVVLRKGLNPILELLLSEGEQQLIHVVHAVFQVGHCDHEPIP